MAYFDLVRSFGEVPLVLTTIKSPSDNMKPSKASYTDIYAQIINDLTFAEANCLPEINIPAAEKGRVSKGAAGALLAKVYLTRAASTVGEAGDKQAALDACNRVITSNLYSVIPVYADIFDVGKKFGGEYIFSVNFELPPHIGNITIQIDR